MSNAELASLLRDEVRREIRTCALFDGPARFTLPPPNDLEAEREVLEALLCGRVRCDGLGQLCAADFYSPSYAAFFAAILALEPVEPGDKSPSIEAIVAVLEKQAICGVELLDELHVVRDGTPACMWPERAAWRVVLAARKRELCACMSRIDGAARLGLAPTEQDCERVRVLLGELQPWWP